MKHILLTILTFFCLHNSNAQSANGYLGSYRYPMTKDYVVATLSKDLSLNNELRTQLGLVFTTYFNRMNLIVSSTDTKDKAAALQNTNMMLDNSVKDLLGDTHYKRYTDLKSTLVPLAIEYDKKVNAGKVE